MARQRVIKPDFWADEKIGKLSPMARLMFIGLWNFSDDKGICRSNSSFIRSQIFPFDDISLKEIDKYLNELSLNDRIKITVFNGESFLMVNNFLKHQRIDKPSPILFLKELSDDKLMELFSSSNDRRMIDDASAPNIREAKLSEVKLSEVNILSSKPDPLVLEVINYLNEKLLTNYKPTGKKTISLIKALNFQGFELEDFKTVINNQKAAWSNDPKMCIYLRPETLFSAKFEGYLNKIESSGNESESDKSLLARLKD